MRWKCFRPSVKPYLSHHLEPCQPKLAHLKIKRVTWMIKYITKCVTQTHARTYTHARTHAPTHARTHTRDHTHIHTHTHARTHVQTCTHARTQTRTHTYIQDNSSNKINYTQEANRQISNIHELQTQILKMLKECLQCSSSYYLLRMHSTKSTLAHFLITTNSHLQFVT